jgi:lipopolysaccharide transport system ATP-binding protein
MSICFRAASYGILKPLTAVAPGGAIIGVIGPDASGCDEVLELAAGVAAPASGEVEAGDPRRLVGFRDPLNLAPVSVLALNHALALQDPLERARSRMGIEKLRRSGAAIVLRTHETDLIRDLCDEAWWFHEGALAARGSPDAVIEEYRRHVHRQLVEWGRTIGEPLTPLLRRGDGRARIEWIETLDSRGRPAAVWQSGETVQVRVRVRFEKAVADPVVGIMIRTRVGFEVFGTNTELECLKIGPVRPEEVRTVAFSFVCALCPQEYTITAASHDPDGVWHDWLEDAVAFSVSAPRYTAGVADLKARAELVS